MGTCRLGPNREEARPEEEAGAPSSCHCVDVQLGGLEGDTGNAGLKHVFKLSRVTAHICGRASHVKADDWLAALQLVGGGRVADHPAGRA